MVSPEEEHQEEERIRWSVCVSLRFRTFMIAAAQLILAFTLFVVHFLGANGYLNDEKLHGHLFTWFPPGNHRTYYQTYHLVAVIVSVIMFLLTLILMCGIFSYKSSFVWAWLLGSSALCIPYAFLLYSSLSALAIGYMTENIIVIGLTIFFVYSVWPYYRYFPYTEN